MKVYVVTYLQSYDGPIFEGVFASEEQAEAYIKSVAPGYEQGSHFYDIEEYEVTE